MSTNTGHETAAHNFDKEPEAFLPFDVPAEAPDVVQEDASEKVLHAGLWDKEDGGEYPEKDLPGTLAGDYNPDTVVIPESPKSLEGSHKRKIAGAILATALAAGGIFALVQILGGGEEHKTQPVAASTPTPSASETSTPTSTTSPTETATQTPTASATTTPTSTETTPVKSGELDITPSLPSTYFEGLIDQSTVDALTAQYPQLEQAINPEYIKSVAARKGVTAEKIAAYQAAVKAAYANPDTARDLGDPAGAMSPSINANLQKQMVIDEIAQTAAGFRKGIAEGLFYKRTGINANLADLVSLDDSYIKNFKHEITTQKADGTMIKNTDPSVDHVDELAVVPYSTVDGVDVTLLATLTKYDDGEMVQELYAVAPIGAIDSNDTLGADFLVAVPFNVKRY